MDKKYNSISYWEPLIREHETLKERIFENEPITDKTMFIHYVIFNNQSGIESVLAPIPDLKRLLGFIEYCFLPEAYYKWIEGKNKPIVKIPTVSVEKILEEAIQKGKVDREERSHMIGDLQAIRKFWTMNEDTAVKELAKFCRKFNTYWLGNSTEFLYLRVFKNPVELGDFVLNTNMQTDYEDTFEIGTSITTDEWIKLCYDAVDNEEAGESLKQILFKELKDIV